MAEALPAQTAANPLQGTNPASRGRPDDTLSAVRIVFAEAEGEVIQVPLKVPIAWMQRCVDVVLGGAFFVFSGFALVASQVGIALALWGGLYLLLGKLEPFMHPGSSASVGTFALLLAVSLVVFGIPSRAAAHGVEAKRVGRVCRAMQALAPSVAAMGRLQQGVDIIKANAAERVNRIGWALGLAWAALSWFVLKYVLGDGVSDARRHDSSGVGLAWLLAYLMLAFFYVGYAVAVRVLHQTLDFAFLDAHAAMDETSVDLGGRDESGGF